MELSAVIIARDEEGDISRCLESLSFCDEIVVVDSGSADRTLEIARRYTDRIHHRDWDDYASQKNFAVGMARFDWVLSLDADEEVSPELREEILSLLAEDPREAAFSIPRKHLYFGKWVRHGGWYPNRQVRLFRKARGKWEGEFLHERWVAAGSVGLLGADLIHYSFSGISDQVERNNRYSTLGALKLRSERRPFSRLSLLTKPTTKFIESYFLKLGLLDGFAGFFISVSSAYSVFLKWAKLRELESRDGSV